MPNDHAAHLPQNLRTLLLAGFALFGLGLGSILFSAATGILNQASPPGEFDAYIALGPRAGGLALDRDLNAQHPARSDLGTLLSRLERTGFRCQIADRHGTLHDCTYNRSLTNRRVALVRAEVHSDGLRVQSIRAEVGVLDR